MQRTNAAAETETIKETASAASRPSLVFYRAALHTSAGTSRPSVELLDFILFFFPLAASLPITRQMGRANK